MLNGKQIYLRTIEPNDAEIIWQWENNPDNWKVSNTLVPFSKKMIQDYVLSAQDLYAVKQIRFIICLNDSKRPVGSIDLFDFDPFHRRVGVGILIESRDDRGKGYASEAIQIVVAYCLEHLQLHQLFCNILESNKTSIHLFEKAGFKVSGSKKDWILSNAGFEDELFLQLINPSKK